MALFKPEYKQTCCCHVIPMQVSGGGFLLVFFFLLNQKGNIFNILKILFVCTQTQFYMHMFAGKLLRFLQNTLQLLQQG